MVQVADWDDRFLESHAFYHGYLPREDISLVLTNHGDFILRSSETRLDVSHVLRREVVISVLMDTENKCANGAVEKEVKDSMVRNIIIHRTGNKLTIDFETSFQALGELIRFYHNTPVTIDKKTVTLNRGVQLTRWEFYHKDVSVGKILGKGAFGEVHKGVLKRKKGKAIPVAIKSLTATNDTMRHKIAEMMGEARIMRNANHPNVVKCYGVAVIEQPFYILLEFVKGGALDSYLKKHTSVIDKDEKFQMMMGACWGLTYLHRINILHRDVATRNCLYDEGKNVKISDFGLSKQGTFYKMHAATKMPVKWMAPESLTNFEFSQKTDVYSFGIVVYEIFACKESYEDITNVEAKKNLLEGKFNEFPKETPKSLVKYIKENCWEHDPRKRASMQAIQTWMEKYTGLSLLVPSSEQAENVGSNDKVD